ncbi:hypothetical protein NQ314_020938 [Rhamnusium bicolor]|uniref:Uncharacterized protein n=1 Tax=Rhamnusium bicolor TaxID=1586634 RepID=A0AAV8WJN2_9CUCU|nr:hypothetical protein NQ314_020938 [Rhamnusium bicolor]
MYRPLILARESKAEEFKMMAKTYIQTFEKQMSSPEMRKLVSNENNEQYDLLLVEYLMPSIFPLKDVYKCPMVGINSLHLTVLATESLGMWKHPGLDPGYYLSFSTNLSFKERVISTVSYYLLKITTSIPTVSQYTLAARKYFGKDTREVLSMFKDVSLV